MTAREKDFLELEEKLQIAVKAREEEKARMKSLCDFLLESAPFFIPEDIKHALMESRFDKVVGIFESAKRVDFSQYPLAGHAAKPPRKEAYEEPTGWEI